MGLSVEAKARIAELWAAGAPAWKIREEAGVSRHAVLRQVRRLRRPVPPERVRSPLRLSLIEREEISRGLAAGRVIAGDRPTFGSCSVDDLARSKREWWPPPLSGVPGRQGDDQTGQASEGCQARAV